MQGLVNQIGFDLPHATQNGIWGVLGDICLNRRGSDAAYALVSYKQFPQDCGLRPEMRRIYTVIIVSRYGFHTYTGTTNSGSDISDSEVFMVFMTYGRSMLPKPTTPDCCGMMDTQLLLLNGVFVNITDPIRNAQSGHEHR